MRKWTRLVLAVWLLFLPAVAHAQASITGVVKDTSGAVLPGVTAEASSPALIEKVRSVVTDSTGQYRIVDLRPGTYAVTFTLTGFNTAKREGVELTGSFTATVNAEMRVGSVTETVTVSGEAPIVDVQSVSRQASVANSTLNEIPSARAYAPILLLMPSVITPTPADVQVTPALQVFSAPGGRNGEGRVLVDGLGVGAALAGAGSSSYVADVSNAQEVTFINQGGLGAAETGGGTINIVPRTGGNSFRGAFDSAFVRSGMVSSNYTPELQAQGLTAPAGLNEMWDVDFGLGGPIRKDKLWFFSNVRATGAYYLVPGMYPNLNEFDATKWTYQPDTAHNVLTATSNGNYDIGSLRLTLQATPRNKFGLFWDEQRPCAGASYSRDVNACEYQPTNGNRIGYNTSTASPETVGVWDQPTRAQQATWSSPVTNSLLLEAGFGTWLGRFGSPVGLDGQPGSQNTQSLVRMQELCITPCPANANIAGLTYRSANWADDWAGTYTWRFSASRVTGAHNMKFGYNGEYLAWDTGSFANNQNLTYFVNNGVPVQLQESLFPLRTSNRVAYAAFYAQDQWTLGRATLQGALRYDRAGSFFPQQQVGDTTFLPNTAFSYPETDGVKWNDISPRGGIAYDLSGNGKTSIKVNGGKYLEAASAGSGTWVASNPTSRLSTVTTRSWNDANHNFVPDCNLTNPLANAAGADTCGPMSVQTFAQNVFTSSVDPALARGWGKRGADWAFSASVQHQILPRTSVEVGYNWRAIENFTVTDNLSVTSSDFSPFSVTAPLDPRLPGGGGYAIGGLYNVSNAKFGQNNNVLTSANNYGPWTQHYNGMLAQINARPHNGLTLQGGVNVGKTVSDNCDVRNQLPESAPTNPFCHVDSGFNTRVTALGSYTIPRIDVLVSSAFRSEQGAQLAANWSVPTLVAAQTLSRPLSGGTPFVTVNLIAPGTLYGNRLSLVDFRIAKIIRIGRTRTNVGIDVYNLMNSDAVLGYNNSYTPGGAWLVPTSVVTPRFVKFSAHVEF
jgi:hypothetical protein